MIYYDEAGCILWIFINDLVAILGITHILVMEVIKHS